MSAKCHFIIKAWPSPSNWLTWLFPHSVALYIPNIRPAVDDIHNIHRWRAWNKRDNCACVPVQCTSGLHSRGQCVLRYDKVMINESLKQLTARLNKQLRFHINNALNGITDHRCSCGIPNHPWVHSLSAHPEECPIPQATWILCPSLTRLDLEEFRLARMSARMAACRTGRPRSNENTSSKPFITECRFTSLLPEVVIWHDICELFDSSVSER